MQQSQHPCSILPVVIVGKDRTLMTCAVIDFILKHVIGALPFFVCVSDNSRPGHEEAVANHFSEIGYRQFKLLHTEKPHSGWGAAMNIGLQYAFDNFHDYNFALMVDNDWLLQKDINPNDFKSILSDDSSIGAITFKPLHKGCNVATSRVLDKATNKEYLTRHPPENWEEGPFSFTAELGCLLISDKIVMGLGKFKENCTTDETEWDFCRKYNSEQLGSLNWKGIRFANSCDYLYDTLNGPNHVFTHVGLNSQHPGPHKWDVPKKYLYLSDDDADAQICRDCIQPQILQESSPVIPLPECRHKKFISVYAIAKNEAAVAERWYNCVKEADEVCVLDTGSTDGTVGLLRSLGATVEVKAYEDWSFSVARNDAMGMVSFDADILFTLDLDETIAPGWRKKLEDAWIDAESKGVEPIFCKYKYIWSFNPDGTEAQSFEVAKIHRNATGRWKYRCHELLTPTVKGPTIFLHGFVVEHHQNQHTDRSNYIDLLEKDVRDMPTDDRVVYYYARELMYSRQWHKAITFFTRHLELPTAWWQAERASSMRNIAYCYRELGNKELCELWLWKSAIEDPTNREAYFHLGEMFLARKDFRSAVKVLAKCIAIEKPSLEYISEPIVWTAKPLFLLAQAQWWTNDWKGAIKSTKKALDMDPNNKTIAEQYHGMVETAKKYNRL